MWMGTSTAPTQDLSCACLLTSSPHQPRPAGPQSPCPCQRPVGAPTCPRRPPEPAGRARCSCLFINVILKTFLINSSHKICLDAIRLLYRLSPGQWRDCMEDSRGSVPRTSVPAWALPATPAGPQDCCSWDAHRLAAVGHQSPHAGSAAQAFITAMKEACRRRGEGWEALSRLAGEDHPPCLPRGCLHPEKLRLGPVGWLLGRAGKQIRPQGTGGALLCGPHTHLLERLPQHLLAVNGAPAGDNATVTLPPTLQGQRQ